MEALKQLTCKTRTNDVDEVKGIVTVAVNGIDIKDADGDISGKGSFNKTLSENFDRCKWFLNHYKTQLLGCPIDGKEENGNLIMSGQINLKKEIGRDTLSDYILYAEHGKTLEHSVGVKAVKRDPVNKSLVHEWFLGEYSTLTHWGANPQTFLIDIKSATKEEVNDQINFIRKALSLRYSDEKLKEYEMNLDILEKALTGKNIVVCPHCGLGFDYNSVPEETLEQQVIDYIGDHTRWSAQDVVYNEMQKLKPEIQERVLEIINSKKSIDDFAANVRCPKCYSRIYKPASSEPAETTQEGKSRQEDTLSLKGLNDLII